jgi:hypothetical protein
MSPSSSAVAREGLMVPSVNGSDRNDGVQFRGYGQRWFGVVPAAARVGGDTILQIF